MTMTRQQLLPLLLLAFCTVLVLGAIITVSLVHADPWHFLSSFNASTAVMTPHS